MTVTRRELEYSFRVQNPGEPVSVRFSLQAEIIGFVRGDVVVNDGQTLSIRQFSYP